MQSLLAKLQSKLTGQYDKQGAVFSLYAGAGGIEAQDWAEMLLTMYAKFLQKQGLKYYVAEINSGKEAGIKNAVLQITSPYAYGFLKNEAGVHRLVRLSPFNANHLRHTSFAKAQVLPLVEKNQELKIKPSDLRVDTYRASGPGGQYVNKTESAVRLTHLPTGLSAACQTARLQGENRERAMALLMAKVAVQQREKDAAKLQELTNPAQASWGNQIRNYVLHPYQMVKDTRTGVKSSQPEKVLAGKLDKFIEAEIK